MSKREEVSTPIPWKPTDNRYIAFLDIMGFKDMVARKTHENIYSKLSKLSKSTEEISKITKNVYITQFSDSIVIFSKDDTIESFEDLSLATTFVIGKSIELGMGIKGAIAKGELSVNKSQQIYFGQALIDAYLLEEDVAYYGVVLHHTAERDAIGLNNKIHHNTPFYIEESTILKSGTIQHFNLNWFFTYEKRKQESILIAIRYLTQIKGTVSGGPRRYIDNTFSMIKKLNRDIKTQE